MSTIDWQKYYPIFQPREFECRCGCGLNNISRELVERLFISRKAAGFPFNITSGCRCMSHNKNTPGASITSAHLPDPLDGICKAADIWCADMFTRFQLTKVLINIGGFVRIGKHPRFVHVDVDLTRPWGEYLY